MSRFLLILALVTLALPSFADVGGCDVVRVQVNPTEAKATDDYVNFADNSVGTTAAESTIIPTALTASDLHVGVDVAPGAGDQWDITVVVNAVPSGLTCTISGTSDECASGNAGTSLMGGDAITLLISSAAGATDPAVSAQLDAAFCLRER